MEEKVFFKTSDGLKLCGILSVPNPSTSSGQANPTQKSFDKLRTKCVVLCHGLTVDKEEEGGHTELAKELCDAGFTVFRFDFRGHGESGGKSVDTTAAGTEFDVEAAIAFLKTKELTEFGIVAASFAGGPVSFFAVKHQDIIGALVLRYPWIDYEEAMNPTLSWTKKYFGKPAFDRVEKFGFTELCAHKFRIGRGLMEELKTLKPWQNLLKIKIPTLFIHETRDTYVRFDHSVKYSKLMPNAELKAIEGKEHGFQANPAHLKEANKATVDFFQKHL